MGILNDIDNGTEEKTVRECLEQFEQLGKDTEERVKILQVAITQRLGTIDSILGQYQNKSKIKEIIDEKNLQRKYGE